MSLKKLLPYLILAFLGTAHAQDTENENTDLREQLVVTATKQDRKQREVPASVSVISEEALKTKAAVVPGDELIGVPGVFFRRQEAADSFMDVTIRGLTGNHGNDTFLALLDGIPFVSAHEEVLLSEIPFGAVERVEVVRGPVSALYGRGALSGAINYQTRTPDAQQRMALDLTANSLGYTRPHFSANLPLGGDTNTLLIDAYYENNEGWRDETGRETTNILIKDEWVVSPSTRLLFYLNAYQNEQEGGGQIPLDADGNILETFGGRRGFVGYQPNTYDRDSIMATVRWQQQLSDRWQLQTTLNARDMQDNNDLNFYDPFGFDPENDILRVNGFANDRATTTTFIEPQVTWQGERGRFVAGANFERVALEETDWWTGQNGFDTDTFDFYFYEININYRTGEIVNRDHPFWVTRNETYRGDSTNQFISLYFQHEVQLTDRFEIIYGARYDRFKREAEIDSDVDFDGVIDNNPLIEDDEDNIAPKLALSYAVNEQTRAYFSYGEGFNANFAAVWQWDPGLYQRGNEVKPSHVRSYELGLKGGGATFAYEAAVFHMTQEDRLVFLPNPQGFGPAVAANADEFRSQGLELSSRVKINGSWQAYVNASYIDAEWREYQVGGTDLAGNRPRGVPEHMVSLGVNGRLGSGLVIDVWGDLFDDYAVTLDNRVIGGGYELLNARLAYQTKNGRFKGVSLTGRNILDEAYYDLFGAADPQTAQPGLPAQVFLSLDFDF